MAEKKLQFFYDFIVRGQDKIQPLIKDIDQLTESMEQDRIQLKKLNAVQRDIRGFERAKEAINALEKQINRNTKEYEALIKKKEKNKSLTLTERRSVEHLQKVIRELNLDLKKEKNRLESLVESLNDANVSTDKLGDAKVRLKTETEQLNKSLKEEEAVKKNIEKVDRKLAKAEDRSRQAGQQLAKGSAAALAGLYPIITKSIEFETQKIATEKALSFKTSDGRALSPGMQAEKTRSIIAESLKASRLGMSPVEYAKILEEGAKQNFARDGREAEDLKRFADLAAKVAVAFDEISVDDAAESLAARLGAGQSLDQLEREANVINYVADNSGAKTGSLLKVLSDVGNIMETAGINSEQTTVLASVMLSANKNQAEITRTAMKNFALNMTKGFSASGKQVQVLEELGFEPKQLAKDMQGNAVQTIMALFEAIAKKDDSEKTAINNVLFGTESIGDISTVIKNQDRFIKKLQELKNPEVNTGIEREFNRVKESTAFNIKELNSNLTALAVGIGDVLLPVLNNLIMPISWLASKLSEFMDSNKELASMIVRIVSLMSAYKIAMLAKSFVMAKILERQARLELADAKRVATLEKVKNASDRSSMSLNRLAGAISAAGAGGDSRSRGRRGGAMKKVGGALVATGVTAYTAYQSIKDAGEAGLSGADVGELVGTLVGGAASVFNPILGLVASQAVGYVGRLVGGIFDDEEAEKIVEDKKQTISEKVTKVVDDKIKIGGASDPNLENFGRAVRKSTEQVAYNESKKIDVNITVPLNLPDTATAEDQNIMEGVANAIEKAVKEKIQPNIFDEQSFLPGIKT